MNDNDRGKGESYHTTSAVVVYIGDIIYCLVIPATQPPVLVAGVLSALPLHLESGR